MRSISALNSASYRAKAQSVSSGRYGFPLGFPAAFRRPGNRIGYKRLPRKTMHELQVTNSILHTVLDRAVQSDVRKILKIRLLVGELNDFQQEWIQRYFDLLSKASIAEGAQITIERVPAAFRCHDCGQDFEVEIRFIDRVQCPQCSGVNFSLQRGRELLIQDMEVE
jgi:hydrogenase nickel incorporation protein HypA/HybF